MTSADKGFRRGTHRLRPPAETLERVRPLMSEMGITRIANVTGLDRIGIPVVTVCRPNSRSIAVSQGKGLDLTAAMVSGLMESVETYHAERITSPLKFASYTEMTAGKHSTVDLLRLPKVNESRFHPDVDIFWIEGQDLISQAPRWVPFEMVHTNYTLPPFPGSGYFLASSNGLASGNHTAEAISHAISELVERDALAVWNLTDREIQASCKIDLATIDDEDCRTVLDRYAAASISVAVWDVTSDIGIPCFYCFIAESKGVHGMAPGIGSGCHPSRPIALLRALTEAAQMRLTVISGARDDLVSDDYLLNHSAEASERFREQIEVPPGSKIFRSGPSLESKSFWVDVNWQLERLQGVGIKEVVVIDLTKMDRIGIPVVRLVIPGLEGPCDHSSYWPGERAQPLTRPAAAGEICA